MLRDCLKLFNSGSNTCSRTDDVVKDVDATNVVGKCVVLPLQQLSNQEPVVWEQNGRHRFYYNKMYDVR